jgi:ERF superfamily protein
MPTKPRKDTTVTEPELSPDATIFERISAVMEDVQAVKKTGTNTQQHYNFRGIDAVVNAVGPAFRKHKVVGPVPHATTVSYRDVQTTTGKPSRECTVLVTYRFYGPKGDFMETEVPGESMDSGDKGTPKAMSVAERIALLQILCIPTDEIEADAQSYERAAAPPPAPAIEPSGRDWIAEAKAMKTEAALLELGNECNSFAEFVGETKKVLLARRQELAAAAAKKEPAAANGAAR